MGKAYKRGKKLNAEILSLRDDKGPGKSTVGVLGEIQQLKDDSGKVLLGNFGQELMTVELTSPDDGEVRKYWLDAGLRGSLKMARVKPGQLLEIVHTGEKEIEQGTVQTYDLFPLEA